jgi:hypothetical protein
MPTNPLAVFADPQSHVTDARIMMAECFVTAPGAQEMHR